MSDSRRLEVGDAVRLRSGGPLMTVESFHEYSEGGRRVSCVYFSPHAAIAVGDSYLPIYAADPIRVAFVEGALDLVPVPSDKA